MSFWSKKKVLVAGGGGFIGSHLVEELLRRAPEAQVTVAGHLSARARANLKAVASKVILLEVELLDRGACEKACRGQDVVLNLAAKVGGVGYNSVHHGSLFRDNMTLALNLLEGARLAGCERSLVTSSACVYPRAPKLPTPESEGFREEPEPTNAGYGWAKRMSEYAAKAYAEEFAMKVAVARPYNAYGPRDDFAPETSHVIPALIRRVVSGEDPLRVWGDGTQTRTFLYVEDFARGCLDLVERRPQPDPVNLGSDEEVTVAELARLIVAAAGTGTTLEFDPSKPAGSPRRRCDTSKARAEIGFQAKTPLAEGLRKTVEWYKTSGEVTV